MVKQKQSPELALGTVCIIDLLIGFVITPCFLYHSSAANLDGIGVKL